MKLLSLSANIGVLTVYSLLALILSATARGFITLLWPNSRLLEWSLELAKLLFGISLFMIPFAVLFYLFAFVVDRFRRKLSRYVC